MKEQDLTPSHENETEPKVELHTEASHDQSENQVKEDTPESDIVTGKSNTETDTELQDKPNYASMEKHELIQRLKLILESELDQDSKERAESIKIHF